MPLPATCREGHRAVQGGAQGTGRCAERGTGHRAVQGGAQGDVQGGAQGTGQCREGHRAQGDVQGGAHCDVQGGAQGITRRGTGQSWQIDELSAGARCCGDGGLSNPAFSGK